MIENYLTDNNIKCDVVVNDWKEAIQAGGNILLENNSIEPEYIDAMIDVVNEHGAYIVLDNGIAMPHARTEKGVKKTDVAILKLQNPVPFGHEEYDPVSIVIVICAKGNEDHLKLLQDISVIFGENDILSLTNDCENDRDLKKIIINCYENI